MGLVQALTEIRISLIFIVVRGWSDLRYEAPPAPIHNVSLDLRTRRKRKTMDMLVT